MTDTTAQPPAPRERDLGHAIMVLRVVRGWDQGELALAAAVAASAISEYERGRKVPGLVTLQRLIEAMGFPLAAIDHTWAYVDGLRTGTFSLTAGLPPMLPGPPAQGQGAVSFEIDQAAGACGQAVTRFARIALHLLYRRPASATEEPHDR